MDDVQTFVEYRRDPEIARYQSWSLDYSNEQARQLIDSQRDQLFPDPGQWLQLGIHLQSTGELVGDLALHNLEREEGVFEIGFTICREHQNNGFAREAAADLLTRLETDHEASRFIASADARNIASIKLLTSLGFTHVQEKGWEEEFKNEHVKVWFFEKVTNASSFLG